MQQLKGKGDEATFGDVSILAVGDLFQLQPVAQPYVLAQVGDAYARLHRSGSLWRDEFSVIELDEIMRQREDAQLRCRVWTATCTEQDIDLLRSRGIKDEDPNPRNSVHVYRLNVDVDEQNISKLKELAQEDQHIVICAIDCTKDKHIRDRIVWKMFVSMTLWPTTIGRVKTVEEIRCTKNCESHGFQTTNCLILKMKTRKKTTTTL